MRSPGLRVAVVAALAAGLGLAGVAPAAARPSAPSAVDDVRSVVVLGDSVAAGEGARDGYVYQDRSVLPLWAARDRVPRAGRCGRTDAAYGVRVASAFDAEVTNLACDGASFGQGIELDDDYDAARPDLVLVTAGANSVAFERAFAYCVMSAHGVSESEAERVVQAGTLDDALARAVELGSRRLFGETPAQDDSACTRAHPGAYLEQTVLDRADEVGRDARALLEEIRARGASAGTVPEVVFTTYPDPLPASAASFVRCPDGAGLGDEQLAYMHDLFAQLNDALRTALADESGVRVADPDPAFAGHRWCDPDPWVLGPSILVADPSSRAPFHPTPAGQRAIAAAVLDVLDADPGAWRGTV